MLNWWQGIKRTWSCVTLWFLGYVNINNSRTNCRILLKFTHFEGKQYLDMSTEFSSKSLTGCGLISVNNMTSWDRVLLIPDHRNTHTIIWNTENLCTTMSSYTNTQLTTVLTKHRAIPFYNRQNKRQGVDQCPIQIWQAEKTALRHLGRSPLALSIFILIKTDRQLFAHKWR